MAFGDHRGSKSILSEILSRRTRRLAAAPTLLGGGAERCVLRRAVGWVADPTETPKIIKLGFQPNLQLLPRCLISYYLAYFFKK